MTWLLKIITLLQLTDQNMEGGGGERRHYKKEKILFNKIQKHSVMPHMREMRVFKISLHLRNVTYKWSHYYF